MAGRDADDQASDDIVSKVDICLIIDKSEYATHDILMTKEHKMTIFDSEFLLIVITW